MSSVVAIPFAHCFRPETFVAAIANRLAMQWIYTSLSHWTLAGREARLKTCKPTFRLQPFPPYNYERGATLCHLNLIRFIL